MSDPKTYVYVDPYDSAKNQIRRLTAERDELLATLQGLCSYLGAGMPDEGTPAVEINKRIHWGIEQHVKVATDELRRVLADMMELDETGRPSEESREQARKLLGRDA